MDDTAITPLRANVLWFATRRTSVHGRACREYEVATEAGDVLLVARAFLRGREMSVATPDGHAVFSILRSRAFPLTGTAVVKELPSGMLIGTVTRNGTFRDSTGAVRGRFRDARSLRERSKESAFQAVMETIFSTDGSMPSGPDALVLHVEGTLAGALTYGILPIAGTDAAQTRGPTRAKALIPRFLRNMWRSLNAPRVWKFSRVGGRTGDPRLELAAALFAAELSRW